MDLVFLACEEKDLMSLLPIWSAVHAELPHARLLTMGCSSPYSSGSLADIVSMPFPVIVSSSPGSAVSYLNCLRPRWSYYFIGVEHGLSPFKKFTYSDAFLVYDDYFAPNALWQQRLEELYPGTKTCFHVGDYPKSKYLISNVARKLPLSKNSIKKLKCVVIFSWGVVGDSLYSLPDSPWITYLLHPSQADFSRPSPFRYANIVRSSEETTLSVLDDADLVFGDLSSLTFEIAPVRPTWLFIDRNFYIADYDIDDGIMDPKNEKFAQVPCTNYKIGRQFILSRKELIRALMNGSAPDKLCLDKEVTLMPALSKRDRDLCTAGILDIFSRLTTTETQEVLMADDAAVEYIRNVYLQILGREPDPEGLQHYLNIIRQADHSTLEVSLDIMLSISGSEEAKNRYDLPRNVWPKLTLTKNPKD
ncbi:DUF4214 domain-containing protein [Novacetimonas pomaceti]|uniref:DUF4214 domain-containing protein n=1 Tax=Novacetimonas pomaceti TaxID=2021998 RepID=UPI001C2D6863|nr:DUF4214 domain-containing protein [Novacetimonas pomaceti]MBV1833585.1 DUF4214 domain-containing protein [Novacetimonas pomaceti]